MTGNTPVTSPGSPTPVSCSPETPPVNDGPYCNGDTGGMLPMAGPVLGDNGPAGYTGGRTIWNGLSLPTCSAPQ